MLKKIRKYAEKWHMLKSEDCVIAGVSGGADSVGLLLVLLELKQEIGFQLVAVHVNHGLRGEEADADETFVKNLCEERGVLLECYSAEVELIAKKRKQSTEEAGRDVRRAFFDEACQKYGGTRIALAHHQNDNAETFFLNLARGTGLKGLGGIAPVNGTYIRPLLCVSREEIESYLREKEQAYCIDKSNACDAYTRNRVRNHIVPFFEREVNEKTIEHMNETMGQLQEVWKYLQEQLKLLGRDCVQEEEGGYLILEDAYMKLPDVLKPMLLRQVMVNVCGYEKDLETVHLESLQQLFEKQSGKHLDLPYEMEAVRVYRGVLIHKKKILLEQPVFVLDKTQAEGSFRWGNMTIRWRIFEKGVLQIEEKKCTKWFDYDIIKDNICFRTRRPGDYLCIHPDGKTQKLKSYFINEKIPQSERDDMLLVAVGSHILWIPGQRRSCKYRVTENTKYILEIHVDEGERDGTD